MILTSKPTSSWRPPPRPVAGIPATTPAGMVRGIDLPDRFRDGNAIEKPITIDRLVMVADQGALHELPRVAGSARLFHPDLPVHVFTRPDCVQEIEAMNLQVEIHPDMNELFTVLAEAALAKTTHHHDYWKPVPIWAKVHALRTVADTHPGEGVCLVDTDIFFLRPFAGSTNGEYWGHAVLSPFYWPDQTFPTAAHHGWFNAGMLMVNSPDPVETWMQCIKEGSDEFYEQACIHRLQRTTYCDYFGAEHNWGKWRRRAPHPGVRSIHLHLDEHDSEQWKEKPIPPHIAAMREAAKPILDQL